MSSLRKRSSKESASKTELVNTFPRKAASRTKSMFDNDFIPSDESPIIRDKFNFETNEDGESRRGMRPQTRPEKSFKHTEEPKLSPRYQNKPRSPFEDDFSPSSEKPLEEGGGTNGGGISSIKEEPDLPEEDEDSFRMPERTTLNGRRKLLSKLSNRNEQVNLKKSESVNIFARENDPFDDEFFSGRMELEGETPRSSELKWTEEFEDSDCGARK